MRVLLPWLIWPLCILFGAGSMMYCNAGIALKQYSMLCAGGLVGLVGDIFLYYSFLGNGESLLFRQRTVRIFGETLCRIAEGSLGVLMVLGSTACLLTGILYFGSPRDPTLTDNELKLTLCIAEIALVLLFTILIAITAFMESRRGSTPFPTTDTPGEQGQDTFNF